MAGPEGTEQIGPYDHCERVDAVPGGVVGIFLEVPIESYGYGSHDSRLEQPLLHVLHKVEVLGHTVSMVVSQVRYAHSLLYKVLFMKRDNVFDQAFVKIEVLDDVQVIHL